MRTTHILCIFSVMLVTAACGGDDDPVNYSAPVRINLKAKSGDAKNGVVSDDKSITTETGNPYGAFISAARDKLGKVDPTRIELSAFTLTLGAKSKNITKLEDAFSGKVEVLFLVDETKNTFAAGELASVSGSGPLDGTVTFKWSDLGPADQDKFLKGSFKVVVRGDTVAGFDKADAEADLQVSFTFVAYE